MLGLRPETPRAPHRVTDSEAFRTWPHASDPFRHFLFTLKNMPHENFRSSGKCSQKSEARSLSPRTFSIDIDLGEVNVASSPDPTRRDCEVPLAQIRSLRDP